MERNKSEIYDDIEAALKTSEVKLQKEQSETKEVEIVFEREEIPLIGKQGPKSNLSQNLNVRAAIIHLMGDMVQSIGVIIAALIIYFKPEWSLADPICTFLFSILVLLTTVPIFTDCMSILMETCPDDVDVSELKAALLKVSLRTLNSTVGCC